MSERKPVSHKACSCPACRAGGNKALIATSAVQDLASENAALRAELAAARAQCERLQAALAESGAAS